MNININNFPLYKILYDKASKDIKSISSQDIKKFIDFTKSCDDSQSEIIYTVIRIYELKNVKKSSSQIYNIPYKGIISINNKEENNEKEEENEELKSDRNNNKNYTFDFNNFPPLLQKMLIQFISIV